MKNKLKKPKFLRFGTVLFLLLFSTTSIYAIERMESDSYKLRFTNLNMTSGSKSSDNYKILDTIGQTAPGQYDSDGYYIKAGFPYIKTIIAFSFTISNLSIDLGILSPNTFSSTNNTLTVSAGGSGGYSVTAQENHPLKLQNSPTIIPDTTCNSGTCDEITANVWNSTSSYGFGFNMQGDDIPSDFTDSTYFRQFANISTAETPQIIMSSSDVGTNKSSTVTYKANIDYNQAAGDYENAITYIATPGY